MFKTKTVEESETYILCSVQFVGVFAKLLKVALSFVMSVCMEQHPFHWMDFLEI
jgi:hypothetical protein